MSTPDLNAIVDAGIDYITATAPTKNCDSGLAAFGRSMVLDQEQQGHKLNNYRSSGYRGLQAGSAAYGIRHDGSIVRLSGEAAHAFWNQCLLLARNVTRLDQQITVRLPGGCADRLREHLREVKRRKTKNGRPSQFKMWVGPTGPEAIMIGSRSSDVFCRIYDKGLETGAVEFQSCLRYEVELKRKLAHRTALELDSTESPAFAIVQNVNTLLGKKTMSKAVDLGSLAPSLVVDNNVARSRVTAHTHLDSLAWLRVSVGPLVARLARGGFRSDVLAALGLMDQEISR